MTSVSRPFRRRIGEILVSEGATTTERIEEALSIQKVSGDKIGAILMDRGWVSERDITKALCLQYQMPFLCLQNYEIDEKLVGLFPKEFILTHKILPFDRIGDTLLVAVNIIPTTSVLEEIPSLTQRNAALYIAFGSEIDRTLEKLFPPVESTKGALDPLLQAVRAGKGGAAGAKAQGAARPAASQPARPAASPAASAPDKAAATSSSDPKSGGAATDDFDHSSFLSELDSTWEQLFQETKFKSKEED